ncbi:hypothetical protein G6R46_002767 [Listeria monocytogenes]|uniref:hypothetical protein n=1 Tax=Listeria monocytogenes TaxID=1639 RepID=UPI00086BDF01|nr:hypothetical protein [Listeria monocytogenes]EAC2632564.1 hypothetical protein [Listeria monocytogenes]EAC9053340.1 hypothetical protein [Listeria monocytogenes]EAD0071586.1 hypothetical protein [Listeria monocytogenes]EAD0695108.1 hypothetical protein [Listeria monocytogenes]EAD5762836.1 hypothetical protein [Listeria monocytogenes]
MKDEFDRYRSKIVERLRDSMKYHMQKNVQDMDLENTDLNEIYQDKLYEILRMIEDEANQIESYRFVESIDQ